MWVIIYTVGGEKAKLGGGATAVGEKVAADVRGIKYFWERNRCTPIRPPATFPHPMGEGRTLWAIPGVAAHRMGLTPGYKLASLQDAQRRQPIFPAGG